MAHPQVLEDSKLPNLTWQFGELAVVELAKKSVLTRRGEAAAHVKELERSEATDLGRNRDQAVVVQLHSNASAKSESETASHVQVRQLRHGQHARGDLGEGVDVELVEKGSQQRHETTEGRTLSLDTRVSCAMLSDTATSRRLNSCGERATREATTKQKEKRTLSSVASHDTRFCSTVPSFFVTSRTISSSDMSRCGASKKKSKFTIDRLCWRVRRRGLNELMLVALP